jgi:hypothetical protein
MSKLIYLIARKDGVTREQFVDAYANHHVFHALHTCVFIDGYTLNFTDMVDPGPGGPDSISEIWTRDVAAFLDPARGFTSAEDRLELMTFFGTFAGALLRYSVDEKLVLGDWPSGEVRRRTPGVKRISFHTGDSRPPITPGLTRVVEQRVLEVFPKWPSPDIDAPVVDAFVCEWAPTVDDFTPLSAPVYLTSEYPQRELDAAIVR